MAIAEQTHEDEDFSTAGGRPTNVRFLVLAAACGLAVITYFHRVGFATIISELKDPLGLDSGEIGILMSTFMFAYGLFEVPWGRFGDLYGVRKPLGIIVLGGSITTAAVAFATILPKNSWIVMALLVPLRFLFAAFQAGTFPTISRTLADWIPTTERGLSQGTIWMSSRLGGALAPLVLVPMFAAFGPSRALLFASGLGIVWALLFIPWYRNEPADMRSVNAAELKIIHSGRAVRTASHSAFPWRAMLRSPSAWALCLAYGATGYSGNFFLTLLPTYLREHRAFDPDTAKWLSALPFACGVISCVLGGWTSDQIIKRTHSKRWGRRIVGATGLGVAGIAIGATLGASNPVLLGVLLCITFAANDMTMASAWAAAADIGERHTGTLAGMMNMSASFTGALMASLTGQLFKAGSLTTPFVIFALVYGFGSLCWLMVDTSKTLAQAENVAEKPQNGEPSHDLA